MLCDSFLFYEPLCPSVRPYVAVCKHYSFELWNRNLHRKSFQNQIDCFSFRCILYMYSFCIKCRLCISQITSCSLLNISLFAAQLFSLFTMSVCPPAIFPSRILQTEIHTKKPEKLHTKITFVIFTSNVVIWGFLCRKIFISIYL